MGRKTTSAVRWGGGRKADQPPVAAFTSPVITKNEVEIKFKHVTATRD